MKQDYKILPQNEKDNSSNNIIPPRTPRRFTCCFITFAILGTLAILAGVAGLTISLIYPNVTHVVTDYWSGQQNLGHENGSGVPEIPVNNGSVTFLTSATPVKDKDKSKSTTPPPTLSTTSTPPIELENNNGTTSAGATNNTSSGEAGVETNTEANTSTSEEEDEEEESEEGSSGEDSTTTTTPPPTTTTTIAPEEKSSDESKEKDKGGKKTHKKGDKKNGSGEGKKHVKDVKPDESIVKLNETGKDKWEQAMEKTEQYLEDATGIHRPEIVVPLFMFVCFLLSLLMASCCCYLLMKRRDNRRRRVLGKIITDLHTGDSKSILLDQDMDD